MKIQQYMWRMRNNCLLNHARQYMKYRDSPKDDSMAIMRALLNNTPECEETGSCKAKGVVADLSHMWTCPSYSNQRDERIINILNIIKSLGGMKGTMEAWFPAMEDQQEMDFGADEIDEEKVEKSKKRKEKKKGRLFDCIEERIRMREWN